MTDNKEILTKTEENMNTWEHALKNEPWVSPLVDIYETEDDFFLNAYLPGVTKENLKIKFEENSLVIMGKVDFETRRNRKYVMRETETGNYYRKFKLSDSVNQDKIEAELINGELIVKLPKHERVKPRTIEIK